jgi:hypothetical protein
MKNLSALFLGLSLWLNVAAQSCLPEGILLSSQEQIDQFRQNYPGCTSIVGNVQICGDDINNLDSLMVIKNINGNLIIGDVFIPVNPNLFSLIGLDSLNSIGGDLRIHANDGLVNLNGLEGLKTIGGELNIHDCYSLTSIEGLSGLTGLGTNLDIEFNPALESLDGLQGIVTIPGNVTIIDIEVTDMTGLDGLVEIGGEFSLISNYDLENLEGLGSLTTIGTNFWLYWNNNISSLEGLNNLTTVGGGLNIQENKELDSLTALESLYSAGSLSITDNDDLISLTGLEGLNSVGSVGISDNDKLLSLMGLEGLTNTGAGLGISFNDNLVSLAGLEGLTTIGGNLGIGGNDDLVSLAGLDNIISVNGNLSISKNESLTSLSGLEQLQSINGELEITLNNLLTTLSGLDNITAGSISDIEINENISLSNCTVQSVCNYLASPNGKVRIYSNAPGCNTPVEIANACGFPLPCLPYGNYYLLSQAEIDSFQVLYPACTMLKGTTWIEGSDITNLNGLSAVTSFSEKLNIFNVGLLTSLAGLEGVIYIGNALEISNTDILETLAGLDNFTTDSTFVLSIYSNHALSTCDIESICNLVSGSVGEIYIYHNAPGCDVLEEVEAACGTGLAESTIPEYFIRISPNPTHGRITLVTVENECLTQLILYNLNGREIKRFELNNTRIELDISFLQSGIYFLKALSDKNSAIYKIVKL